MAAECSKLTVISSKTRAGRNEEDSSVAQRLSQNAFEVLYDPRLLNTTTIILI